MNNVSKKMLKGALATMAFAASAAATAQVGIGTQNPLGVFHVDGLQDNVCTPTAQQESNDFVVDAQGRVGIGVAAPAEKLEINASMIAVRDGSQGQGKVFVSDKDGVGTWKAVSDNGQTIRWEISNTNVTFTGAGYETLTGTTAISGDAHLTAANGFRKSTNYPDATLVVPKGMYMVLVSMETLNSQEYGKLQIWAGDNPASTSHNDTTGPQIYKIFYQEKLTGSSFMYNFEQDTPVHATLRLNPPGNPVYDYAYWNEPPLANRTFSFFFCFIKLNFDGV